MTTTDSCFSCGKVIGSGWFEVNMEGVGFDTGLVLACKQFIVDHTEHEIFKGYCNKICYESSKLKY